MAVVAWLSGLREGFFPGFDHKDRLPDFIFPSKTRQYFPIEALHKLFEWQKKYRDL